MHLIMDTIIMLIIEAKMGVWNSHERMAENMRCLGVKQSN